MIKSLLTSVGIVLMASLANAQPIPPNQECHHDENHWYPCDCCSDFDCELIPIDAVVEVDGGWQVEYRSNKKNLGYIKEFVPKQHPKVKPNEHDGQFHGCWVSNRGYSDNRYGNGYGVSGMAPLSRMICFWYPLWS